MKNQVLVICQYKTYYYNVLEYFGYEYFFGHSSNCHEVFLSIISNRLVN
jgi:hypothetical protein